MYVVCVYASLLCVCLASYFQLARQVHIFTASFDEVGGWTGSMCMVLTYVCDECEVETEMTN